MRASHYAWGRILAALPVAARQRIFAGTAQTCPVCDSGLRGFLTLYRDYFAFCPVCWSLQRHRLTWLFIQRQTDLLRRAGVRLLHVAPEASLEARFRRIPGVRYLSGDLTNPRAMEQLDVCDIRHPNGAFDVVYCSHVLEHVPDDARAMREFHRVLAGDGWALLLVPITVDRTTEDASVTDPAARERVFGQHDHVRRYGMDFADRAQAAGFTVSVIRTEDVAAKDEIVRMGLTRCEPLFFGAKAGSVNR